MNQQTTDFVFNYAQDRDPEDAIESLAYLCRMLWLCRSDKLRSEDIPHLVELSNAAFQASEQHCHLPRLPNDARAYRLHHHEVYFKGCNHYALSSVVAQLLRDVLIKPEPEPEGIFSRIWKLFSKTD